ncbi:MAG: AAA family ATPase [Nitrospinae bacterium]|nr:AAA family ATPase [Nitrospinota bacterium]
MTKSELISVGSGKGGTGKSFFSYLLGKTIANQGKKTLLFDGDLGCANLHTLCGLEKPRFSLSDFINNKSSLKEIIVKTPTENLFLISGASDSLNVNSLAFTQKRKLLHHLRCLDFDSIIIDVGPDISHNNLDLYSAADYKFLVLNPEQVSLENCFRYLKAVLLRQFSFSVGIKKSKTLFGEELAAPFQAVNDMHQYISDNNKEMLGSFRTIFNETEFYLVVNKTLSGQRNVAEDFKNIVAKYLTTNINLLGEIPFNLQVMDCYSKGTPPDIIPGVNTKVEEIYSIFQNIK